jgi:hypothetical protein
VYHISAAFSSLYCTAAISALNRTEPPVTFISRLQSLYPCFFTTMSCSPGGRFNVEGVFPINFPSTSISQFFTVASIVRPAAALTGITLRGTAGTGAGEPRPLEERPQEPQLLELRRLVPQAAVEGPRAPRRGQAEWEGAPNS